MKAASLSGVGGVSSYTAAPIFVHSNGFRCPDFLQSPLTRQCPFRGCLDGASLVFWCRPGSCVLKIQELQKRSICRNSGKSSESQRSDGEILCWRKQTGRQDSLASQWRGDRTAIRAAAPTQRGQRTLQILRWRRGKGAYTLQITCSIMASHEPSEKMIKWY